MRYIKMTKYDTANGPGIRTTLWVSGCTHKCKGCHNPQTWDPNSGELFTDEVMDELLESLSSDYIAGITLSGGDPLYSNNLRGIIDIIDNVRKYYPNKNIWLYTGYTWENIIEEIDAWHQDELILSQILHNIDVLVDGKFEINQKNISLPYCGSSNQRVIDVKKSLSSHKVVLYES